MIVIVAGAGVNSRMSWEGLYNFQAPNLTLNKQFESLPKTVHCRVQIIHFHFALKGQIRCPSNSFCLWLRKLNCLLGSTGWWCFTLMWLQTGNRIDFKLLRSFGVEMLWCLKTSTAAASTCSSPLLLPSIVGNFLWAWPRCKSCSWPGRNV